MADLKYFISESQGFSAGDGYVEGCMMAGKKVAARGRGGVEGAGGAGRVVGPPHLCTLLQQWATHCPL